MNARKAGYRITRKLYGRSISGCERLAREGISPGRTTRYAVWYCAACVKFLTRAIQHQRNMRNRLYSIDADLALQQKLSWTEIDS